METIDLGELIEQVITKFDKNRIGGKPTIFVSLPPDLPHLPDPEETLQKLLTLFLYDALLMNHPESPIRMTASRRTRLEDLEAIAGVKPLCWIQLRISGRDLKIAGSSVRERFESLGYRPGKSSDIDGADAILEIFTPVVPGAPKLIFCFDAHTSARNADLLIPVSQRPVVHMLPGPDGDR